MAAAKSRSQPNIGSAQWIEGERSHAKQLFDEDVEEFGYAARRELEWLNEHMAEIFSKQQLNLTDVFKTPGKLRGKTPRTNKKKDPQRAPLTDLFAPNPQSVLSPAQRTPFYQKVAKIAVARENDENEPARDASPQRSPLRPGKKNTDSGYHGLTEDEMDLDALRAAQPATVQQHSSLPRVPATNDLLTVEGRPTEESFVSAQEIAGNNAPADDRMDVEVEDDATATVPDETMHAAREAMNAHVDDQRDDMNEISIHEDEQEPNLDAARPDSASDTSSPEQPLIRKSSLNFASLPPRETLTGKRSMGVRNSQLAPGRASQAVEVNEDVDIESEGNAGHEEAAAHNKTSTQRLHERITMLGQTREPRNSRSIPATHPMLPAVLPKEDSEDVVDDDDDWIAPIGDRTSSNSNMDAVTQDAEERVEEKRIYGHQKSISTTNILSPTKDAMAPEPSRQKASSVSVPNMGAQAQATTPTSSPKRFAEGPLSASKARFYSVLKSAKGMFASSAGASAQAKVEASTLSAMPSTDSLVDHSAMSRMPGGFEDDAASLKTVNTANTASSRPLSAFFSPSKEGRKTRSSTENERKKGKQTKQEQKAADDLEKIREKERKKAAQQKQDRDRAEQERLVQLESEREEAAAKEEEQRLAAEREQAEQQAQAANSKAMGPPGKLRAPGRLVKPARQAPTQAAKPVPVNIRVASQVQRLGSAQPSASTNSLLDPTPPPTSRPASAAGRPGVTRAGSAAPSNARVKALEAAARKKELEEKAAARKAEQKKELERKRAAKLEEDRRAEQEKRAEEQRKAQDARAAAQRQAEQRKLEQQRREAAAAAARAKAEAEMAEALERERARAAQAHRADLPGTMRQLTKSTIDVAPKGAKRPLGKEAEESGCTSTLNRGGPSYQQQDAKRRRTEDEEDFEMNERHSVMAPPKRPSNMRKETLSKFPHGYAHAPPPAAHHAQNIYKASISSQPVHQALKPGMHPNETIKLSNARIPFAENANPPEQVPQPSYSSAKTATANTGTFKTPLRPALLPSNKTKSSPAYPNGDAIALPEINTDSEDESDSDTSPATKNATASFRAPSWVASPALRDLLTQQQLVDPESVFGPIATLNMDEVFKGGSSKNQERMRRYRERGESAMWVESGDQVTSAEKRRDREARERVVREGGWRFGGDL
ncbi:Inner centromere protein-related protein pic1-like protein [Elsinoe fawcettii]|nr:Inner centromere protein-related protein pic1-like protein [Elsinoe fawcettii]